jgi:hypothetical protein
MTRKPFLDFCFALLFWYLYLVHDTLPFLLISHTVVGETPTVLYKKKVKASSTQVVRLVTVIMINESRTDTTDDEVKQLMELCLTTGIWIRTSTLLPVSFGAGSEQDRKN